MIEWDSGIVDEITPPPDGFVGVGKLGTVVMNKTTFQAFQDYGAEIDWECKENGD